MPRRAPWDWMLLLPVALAAWVASRVGSTWAGRRAYPFDLEWMEGGVLAHAWRVQHLEPLYVDPGPDFVPMVYTPGYYYVLAALTPFVELSHALGRTVSATGTLLAAAALVALGRRQTASALAGAVGAGVYLGCYELSGAFYDLVRPDALAVGLLAWTVVLAAERDARVRVAAALLLACAFVVKHNMAAFGVPLALGVWAWRGWRQALVFGLVAAVPAVAWTLAMQVGSGGRFLSYVLAVPASHPMQLVRAWPGLPRETGHALPVALAAATLVFPVVTARAAPGLSLRLLAPLCLLGALGGAGALAAAPEVSGLTRSTAWEAAAGGALAGVALVCLAAGLVAMARARTPHGPWVFAAGVGLCGAVVAGLMRAHHGGFLNVLMPWHWIVAAGFTLTLGELLRHRPGTPQAAGAFVATLLATGQLGLLAADQHLERLVPTAEDVEAGERLVALVAEHDGPVLSPFAPWIAAQAGHRPGYHLIALWDIRHKGGPFYRASSRVTAGIRDRHYATVVDAQQTLGFGVRRTYVVDAQLELPPRVLLPRTGWPRRPTLVLVPGDGDPQAEDVESDEPAGAPDASPEAGP